MFKTDIKINGKWFTFNPKKLEESHPLDFGNLVETELKDDLLEIREQYEQHIKSSPWLQKLRQNYDKLLAKHELFAVIKGDDDAEI